MNDTLKQFTCDRVKGAVLMYNCYCVASAPFTIQRLCELLIEPTKHYKTMEKFLRAVEKVTYTL